MDKIFAAIPPFPGRRYAYERLFTQFHIYKEAREFDNLSSQSHIDLEYCSVPYHYRFSKPIRRDRHCKE